MLDDNSNKNSSVEPIHQVPHLAQTTAEIGNNAFLDDLPEIRENNLNESFAPRLPTLPKRRLLIGTLLLIVGIVTFSIGLRNKDTIVIAIGGLAFLPGAYNSYVFFMVYCLRRTEMFNQLEDER